MRRVGDEQVSRTIECFELFGHSVKRRRKLCKFIFAAYVYARGEIAATHLRDAFAQLADWLRDRSQNETAHYDNDQRDHRKPSEDLQLDFTEAVVNFLNAGNVNRHAQQPISVVNRGCEYALHIASGGKYVDRRRHALTVGRARVVNTVAGRRSGENLRRFREIQADAAQC